LRRFTSDTASRSFCAECSFVEPDGLSICFVREVCSKPNLGLLWRTESSIGGSIFVVVEVMLLIGHTRLIVSFRRG
jgi:hypothetical protein